MAVLRDRHLHILVHDLGLNLRNLHLHDLLNRALLDVRNLDDALDVLDFRDMHLALLHDRHRLVDDALLDLDLRDLDDLLDVLDLSFKRWDRISRNA